MGANFPGWASVSQSGSGRVPVASINGLILDRWLELGGPESDLGFPIADEAVTADGVGRFGLFQSGAIYWHQIMEPMQLMEPFSKCGNKKVQKTVLVGILFPTYI
ncbi:LGFP repeat-containing protein [Corynebacterium glutamicum]|uniref:LGFP repeat-containing protein n=1 Tax=Corynebacterium glutamicum TaxID=1718 RepID=UPI001E48683D|nr:hypothetical protein [Corynebacterium glutamicum]